MTTKAFHRLSLLILACMVTLALGCAAPAHAQVAVMVNGEPITNFDIEQRGKLNFLTSHKPPVRQQIVDELIDEKVKIREGKKFGVDPTTSDIDSSFSTMSSRMHLTPDQLAKSLESQGIRTQTLRGRIRAEMVWTSLVRGRFKESLQVGEKEVAAAAGSEAPSDPAQDMQSFEYKMQPIVLVVPRGSPPSATELRLKDAETLRSRVQTCDEANSYFKSMPNAAIRDPISKTSADLPAPIRSMLDSTPIGHLTPPEVTKQGIEMSALCERKPTTIDTPKKKEVRDKMFAEKYEAKSKSYLREVRGAAMIEYR